MEDALRQLAPALAPYAGRAALVACCLVLLGFCSLAEAALVRVDAVRARQLANEAGRRGRRLARLVEHRQEVLTSLVLVINVSIIVISAYTTDITIGLSGGSERWVPLTSVVMIGAILLLCELTPKTYAMGRAESVALAAAPSVALLHRAVGPLERALHLLAIGLIRHLVRPLIGGDATPARPLYSDEEVLALVTRGEAEGDIEEEEREMIHGVIEFSDKVAREVMTPRTDMVCVPAEASLLEAARLSEQTGYSRLPVYEGSVDHIIGIVYAKDMVAALDRGAGEVTAAEIARKPAPVVPESKNVSEVLRLMQRNRLHQVVVIDEYGGTAGLVTIEDLLEEIFGEIRDEYDVEAEPIHEVSADEVVVDARVSVDELEDRFGVALPEGEFDSVGGFILDRLGRLPAAGERVSWQNLDFAVEAVSENRILRVRVTRRPEPGPPPEGARPG